MKKKIAGAVILAVCLRLMAWTGISEALSNYVKDGILDGSILTASVNFELGGSGGAETAFDESEETAGTTDPSVSSLPETPGFASSPVSEPHTDAPTPAAGDVSDIIPTTISGGLKIDNATSFDIDIAALMAEPILSLPSSEPQILIIHTHGSEAYTPDGVDKYNSSDGARTQEKEFSVIRVGDELQSALASFGLNVIHDREIYDYPSYNGSYGRSGEAVERYLTQYPNIAVVIDLHRDALGSGDTIYKTVANVSGEKSSQLMLLVGTGENGLSHPDWQENLKLALYLQSAVVGKYPSLARPVALKQERYNQQLTHGSLILEVGSSGNTLQEALCAVRLFADAVGEPLKALIK